MNNNQASADHGQIITERANMLDVTNPGLYRTSLTAPEKIVPVRMILHRWATQYSQGCTITTEDGHTTVWMKQKVGGDWTNVSENEMP